MKGYRLWNVRTESDVEGKQLTDLGTYEGHIDDIALHLSSRCVYVLYFTDVARPEQSYRPSMSDATLRVTGMTDEEIRHLFIGRDIKVNKRKRFGGIHITASNDNEIKKQALDKLTYYEKKVLGLLEDK